MRWTLVIKTSALVLLSDARARPHDLKTDCAFHDADGTCHPAPHRGACGRPADGGASPFVNHADAEALCKHNPPYGFKPICRLKPAIGDATQALEMLRRFRDPPPCRYRSCAVVGASGSLLGARLGAEIDAHDAVIRVNLAPDGRMAAGYKDAPHSHVDTWLADVGGRTTWRVITMEIYGYLRHYSRHWLAPPVGKGAHPTMHGIPQEPYLAVSCHQPSSAMGRCRIDRLAQTFAHPEAASFLISPLLMLEQKRRYFHGVKNQRTPSTGMTAVALAHKMCDEVHLYGFGNGSCGDVCYHYYDCVPDRKAVKQDEFLSNTAASYGYHNFSAQALALRRMHREGDIHAHWGACQRSFGDPADGVYRTAGGSPRISKGGRTPLKERKKSTPKR